MLLIFPTDTCFWLACPIDDIIWYEKIYTLKARDFSKPLAVLVPDFEYLKQHTIITPEQLAFVRNYPRPWSVLLETRTDILDGSLPNRDFYTKISFRVAHTDVQRDLTHQYGPLFLTSANLSWQAEIYDPEQVRTTFGSYPEIEIYEECLTDTKNPPSDIFEFIGDGVEVRYLRKN